MFGRQVDLARRYRCELVERACARFEVEVIRNRCRFARSTSIAVGLPHHHETIDIPERRRPQQDRIDDAEDSGVRADAERERENQNDGECGRLLKRPERVANVRPQVPTLIGRLRR